MVFELEANQLLNEVPIHSRAVRHSEPWYRYTPLSGCLPQDLRSLKGRNALAGLVSGIGHVTVGMARQSYDLQLTRYDEKSYRATFYTTGMEHSPTSATSTGW